MVMGVPAKLSVNAGSNVTLPQKTNPQNILTIGHLLTAPFYRRSPAPLGRLGATDLSGAGRYVRSSA